MKIAFFSNYFNHHQKPLADAFNSIVGVEYYFVAISSIPEFRKNLGYKEMTDYYVIDTTISDANKDKAIELSKTADVAIYMAGRTEEYIIPRLKLHKLTFEVSERRFKRGYINMFSPNLIKHQLTYFRYGRNVPFYMLCCSAYAANDYNFLSSFVNRCFKWAYFTKVDESFKVEASKRDASTSETTPLMWCGRFLKWKHPELPVLMAAKLKREGYKFVLDMYGNGDELEPTKTLATKLGCGDVINFCGNHPNEIILDAMRNHKIFLFTSDRHEGWGAVANESMSNGCALVGSESIGSVPYLVKDGINGMIYKGTDVDSLTEKVRFLLDNPNALEQMRLEAVRTMQEVWSPKTASARFLELTEELLKGNDTPFIEGPCSKAQPYRYNTL